MDILIRYGMSIEEIKNMIDSNPDINNIPDEDISKIIELLESIGCKRNHITNILITNPFLLTKELDEIIKTIDKLKEIGITHIELLLDTNPYLLNITYKEIDSMEKYKIKQGKTSEEIIDEFYHSSEV